MWGDDYSPVNITEIPTIPVKDVLEIFSGRYTTLVKMWSHCLTDFARVFTGNVSVTGSNAWLKPPIR